MYIVGLTGGIASGKSMVASTLVELGIPVCDTDVLARQVVEKGTVGLQKLTEKFGVAILNANGELDREKLARMVFADSQVREQVNVILHPLIFKSVNEWLDEQDKQDSQLVVVDVPLLFEVGYDKQVDAVLTVYLEEKLQVDRLMARNNYTIDEAKQRLVAQMPLIAKAKRSDFVIDNNGTFEETIKQVITWLNTVKTMIKS